MKRATFLASVEVDLIGIFTYLAETTDSVDLASRFVGRLRDHCHHLAGLPGTLGRERSELRPDIRSTPFRSYVIFFRYAGERFEVVNILHGRRDIHGYFENE